MNFNIRKMLLLAFLFPVFSLFSMSEDESNYWRAYSAYYKHKLIIYNAQERITWLRNNQPDKWEQRIKNIEFKIVPNRRELSQTKLEIMSYMRDLDEEKRYLWLNVEKIS